MNPVYLDHNASTPVHPDVLAAMMPFLTELCGHPGAAHVRGAEARRAIDVARAEVAAFLRAEPDEIVFTGGATEANNLAITGTVLASGRRSAHIVTTAVEHPSVRETVRALEALGHRAERVGVDGTGRVDPAAILAAVRPDTVLVSVMLANNEVGTLEPVREIAAAARARGVRVHTDAAQAAGKIPVDANDLGVDFLTLAGHKFQAPKGVGALFVRRGTALRPVLHGGPQESGLRPGTENVALIAGLGRAAAIAGTMTLEEREAIRSLRDRLEAEALGLDPAAVVLGHPSERLPNTVCVAFRGRRAPDLLARMPGVCASTGAACHDRSTRLSETLTAMGVPLELGLGAVRFSLGRTTRPLEIGLALASLSAALRRP